MVIKKYFVMLSLLLLVSFFISCNSQEYTTAKLALQQSEWEKAEEYLLKAIEIEPENPEIPLVLGIEIYAKNKAWKEMSMMFDRAMSIDSLKNIEIRGLFKPVTEQVDNYKQFYWAEQFNTGVETFKKIQKDENNKSNYLESAISNFKDASVINPGDSQTLITLSKCYFDLGNKNIAADYILKAAESNPNDFNSNFSAGQILLRCNKPKSQAVKFFKIASIIDPSNSTNLRELASVYYDLGEKEKSIEIFQNSINNEDDKIIKADLYFNLGVIHNQMKNYKEAEKAFDEAFYLNEEDYEAALGMASSYEGLGDKYLKGLDGFEKNKDKAARWFRKAEKRIKDVKSIDIDNSYKYQKQLELIRYKRDIAEKN
tara:strand:+ start:1294 stop:2406 length:1113 start_codon:yes stop_codon:yes gene_type:complete